MNNPFLLPDDEYTRSINTIGNYVKQQAFYIHTMTSRPIEEVKSWLVAKLKDPETGLKDPEVKYLSRENSVDRYRAMMKLSQYILSVEHLDYPMVPTFTVYQPKRVRESLYSTFISTKKSERKQDKKQMFKAIMDGDLVKAAQKNNDQQSRKRKINALSGAALMRFSPNYTSSLHPTLTSVCRISTSYSNANNEKLMGGNRMYLNEKTTLDDINLLAMCADEEHIRETIEKYNLVYPTVEQALECVRRTTDLYWSRGKHAPSLENYLVKLKPHQLANIVYSGDLYHLAKFNDEAIRKFIVDFISVPQVPVENPDEYMSSIDGHTEAFVSYLCANLLKGSQLAKVKNEDPETYKLVGGVCKGIIEQLDIYSTFISCFLRPKYLPPNIYNIQAIERKVVVTSDTDSTIFTTQHWTAFVTGSHNFKTESYNVGYFMTWLASQMVVHQLSMMSRNIGIERDNLHKISMKSEYYFPSYVITPASKHYFAYISAREGNVYEELELEVKGVNLRTSNLPASIMGPFNEQLEHILTTVIKNSELTIEDVLRSAYDVETAVKNSLESGSVEYLKSFQLKTPESYKQGVEAPNFKAHRFWQECFAPKYGDAPPLPYIACNVGTTLTNPTRTKQWLASIEDEQLRGRITEFLKSEGKMIIPTIRVPKALFDVNPIPPEIINAIDIPKTLLNIMAPWYLYLEAMGFYLRNPKNTRLISNEFRHVLDKGLHSRA